MAAIAFVTIMHTYLCTTINKRTKQNKTKRNPPFLGVGLLHSISID